MAGTAIPQHQPRGYVQLTWDFNYQRYSEITGLDLLNNPGLALRPDVSLFVLIHGSLHGIFTGRALSDYIGHGYCDYYSARRVINGLDKAAEIEAIAYQWAKYV